MCPQAADPPSGLDVSRAESTLCAPGDARTLCQLLFRALPGCHECPPSVHLSAPPPTSSGPRTLLSPWAPHPLPRNLVNLYCYIALKCLSCLLNYCDLHWVLEGGDGLVRSPEPGSSSCLKQTLGASRCHRVTRTVQAPPPRPCLLSCLSAAALPLGEWGSVWPAWGGGGPGTACPP